MLGTEKEYDLTLQEHKEKRSLDANSYMWVLADKLAAHQGITKDEVYCNAVRRVGVWHDWENLTVADAKTLATSWGMLGTGWISEQPDYEADGEHVRLRTYYGSSKYNKKQFLRLINDIVEDCHECGIETMTPDEIAKLRGLTDDK